MTDANSSYVSDNIVTPRAVRPGFDSLQEQRFFSSPRVQTSSRAHLATSRNGIRELSYGVKRTGRVGNHSSQFSGGRAVTELCHVRGRMHTGRTERVTFHTIVILGVASGIVLLNRGW